MMGLTILLALCVIEMAALIYLEYKSLNQETQKEVLRKVKNNPDTEILDWTPPQRGEEIAANKIIQELNEGHTKSK